jgi:glycosyltransferase involved in cell wall biosynthesis
MLYAVGDKDALAEGLNRMLANKPLRSRHIKKGAKRAEFFSVEKIAQEYQSLF